MSKLRPWEDTFPDIGWNYAMGQPLRSGTLRQRSKSGLTFQRQLSPDVRLFEFIRNNATSAQKQQIENFHREHRDGFFIVAIPAYYFDGTNDQVGYFAVEFERDPQIAYVGANSWFIDVRLRESVGKLVGNNILPGVDGLFNIWTGANTPQGWSLNTDNTQVQLVDSMGTALKITADGLANPGFIQSSPALGQGILSNKLYTASFYIMRSAGYTRTFDIDIGGTGFNTTNLVIPYASISTVAMTRHEGDISGGGILINIPTDAVVRCLGAGTPPVAENLWLDELMVVEGAIAGDRLFADPRLGYPSLYIDEEDGETVSGTWTQVGNAKAHEERHSSNPNTAAGEQFRFHYFGRGFYLVAARGPDRGIGKCTLDGVNLGNFDQYNAAALSWDRLIGRIDVALGQHEVIIETTNTKNAASSANTITADAIEVIP